LRIRTIFVELLEPVTALNVQFRYWFLVPSQFAKSAFTIREKYTSTYYQEVQSFSKQKISWQIKLNSSLSLEFLPLLSWAGWKTKVPHLHLWYYPQYVCLLFRLLFTDSGTPGWWLISITFFFTCSMLYSISYLHTWLMDSNHVFAFTESHFNVYSALDEAPRNLREVRYQLTTSSHWRYCLAKNEAFSHKWGLQFPFLPRMFSPKFF
jgi:hypothetical protein